MKKVFAAGMLAVCLIAVSQQQASAWVNTRFGIGLNAGFQSGGNSFLWGAWRNGQPPGPDFMSSQPQHQHHHHDGGQFQYFGAPVPHAPVEMPSYAQPSMNHGMPYQFATYPRPTYYYSTPYYYGR